MEVEKKLEELQKYVPLIDFMINLDREKYKKFIDIKNWIIKRTRFPLIDLEKIERSILIQYKSLKLPQDKKIPKSLRQIINTSTPPTCIVDLCSDDEDKNSQTGCSGNDNLEKVDDPALTPLSPTETKNGTFRKQNIDEHTKEIFQDIEQIISDLGNGQDCTEEKLFTRRSDYPKKRKRKEIHLEDKLGDMVNSEAIVLSSNEEEDNTDNKSNNSLDKETASTSTTRNNNNNKLLPNETSDPVQDAETPNECDLLNLNKLNVEELYHKLIEELGRRLGIKNNEYLKNLMNNLLVKDTNECSKIEQPKTSISQNTHNTAEKSDNTTLAATIPPHIQQFNNNHITSKATPPIVGFPSYSPYIPFIQPPLTSSAPAVTNRPLLQHTINLKDPRIIRKLQLMQNSPNCFANIPEIAAYNYNTPHPPISIQPQLVKAPIVVHNNETQRSHSLNSPSLDHLPTPGSRLMLKGHNSRISYGEYKKRKAEEKLQKNNSMKNSEKNDVRINPEAEMMEKEKSINEIRLILCSALADNEKEIESAWNRLNQSTISVNSNSKNTDENEISKNHGREAPKKSEQSKPKSKIDRIYKELHCSMKGYNTMRDFIPTSIGGKRRSSLHAREMISAQLNNASETSSLSNKDDMIEKIKIRRTSDGQYKIRSDKITQKSDEGIENGLNLINSKEKILHKSLIPNIIQSKTPLVKVKRLTNAQIYRKQSQLKSETSNIRKITPLLKRTSSVEQINNKPQKQSSKKCKQLSSSSQQIKGTRRNNDCQMTELNTQYCTLCTSKPADLTNHYIRKHKTESYVSRLTSAQLHTLKESINFATPQYKNNAGNVAKPSYIRYKVSCPFCEEELLQPFLKLYDHYSKHTGEYPYACSFCALSKPFRADIQSHQQNSKNCHKASINIMYRYRQNTTVIHLHYCRICNFAQLNEANVLKHLREHHSAQQAVEQNVEICVLAAIQDACETNEDTYLMSQNIAELQKESDEIISQVDSNTLVCNEAINDDVEMANSTNLTFNTPLDNENILQCNNTVTSDNNLSNLKVKQENEICIEQAVLQAETTIAPTSILLEYVRSDKENEVPLIYRLIPPNVNYLGLYKCMADDCYYSTESDTDMLEHLTDHENSLYPPEAYLQCAYCVLHLNECNTSMELVQHIRLKHQHNVYQCSVCCYRSCDASNVFIHQQIKHPFIEAERLIYKCKGPEITYDDRKSLLNELKIKSVQKLKCPICECKFYATIHLQQHLDTDHDLDARAIKLDCLKTLSCIYCENTDRDKRNMHIHLASNHPNELPYICDHNVTENNEDSVDALQLFNLSQMMAVTVKVISSPENDIEMPLEDTDVKPDIIKLLAGNEETVKVRLRKLTESTGIDLDHLYRCPEIYCGGYFSSFELWQCHMKRRHRCLISFCPHCPQPCTNDGTTSTKFIPLDDFQQHFEKHRRHTYVCFHCPETFKYLNELVHHGENIHQFKEVRFEKVKFSFHCSYTILIEKNLHKDRLDFLRHYIENSEVPLKKLKERHLESLQHQWLVVNTASWLDEFSVDLLNYGRFTKCIKENECNFYATNEKDIFEHMRTQHTLSGATFRCTQCYYILTEMNDWNVALNHVRSHLYSMYICCVCSTNIFCRSRMTEHIKANHNARDVPVIHLLKKSTDLYIELNVVFASGLRSFSSTRNCFCCNERNMTADTLLLHLKHYHKFTLIYFCEFCKMHLSSLKLCGQHFSENHPNEKIKLHCKFASNNSLSIESIQPFRLNLNKSYEAVKSITIKEEEYNNEVHDDNAVIILEDDDISINEDIRLQASISKTLTAPKLQCIPMNKLLNSTDGSVTPPTPLKNHNIPVRITTSSTNMSQLPSHCQFYETSSSTLLPTTFKYFS